MMLFGRGSFISPTNTRISLSLLLFSFTKHLARRPDKVELVRANILPDSTAAPALQRQQKELEKQMLADALEKRLQARPERGALARYLQGEWKCTVVLIPC